MNDISAPLPEAAAAAFFERAHARLTLDVPPALTDPKAGGIRRGDLDLDPALWERAGVNATKPASVLIPVIDRDAPTVLLTLRTADGAFPGPGHAPTMSAAVMPTGCPVGHCTSSIR